MKPVYVEFVWRGGDSVGIRITTGFDKIELGIIEYPCLWLLFTIPEEYGGYKERYERAVLEKEF